MKDRIRVLIRRYAGRPMDKTQEELEEDLLNAIIQQIDVDRVQQLDSGKTTLLQTVLLNIVDEIYTYGGFISEERAQELIVRIKRI